MQLCQLLPAPRSRREEDGAFGRAALAAGPAALAGRWGAELAAAAARLRGLGYCGAAAVGALGWDEDLQRAGGWWTGTEFFQARR